MHRITDNLATIRDGIRARTVPGVSFSPLLVAGGGLFLEMK